MSGSKFSIKDLINERIKVIGLILILFGIVFLVCSHWLVPEGLFHHLTRDFGIALIPTGLIVFIYEMYLRAHLMELMKENIKSVIEEEYDIVNNFKDAGVKRIYKDRGSAIEHLNKLVKEAKSEVKILCAGGTLLNLLSSTAVFDSSNIKSLKILVLDPNSQRIKEKEKQRNVEIGHISNEIKMYMSRFEKIFADKKTEFDVELRFYDIEPLCGMIIIDNTKLMTYTYLHGQSSADCPWFEIEINECSIGKKFIKHFEFIWDRGKINKM